MWQFFLGTDEAFEALEAQARRGCVRFAAEAMPPGAEPSQAAVGFEISPTTGIAHLFVDRGVTYAGGDDEIRAWLQNGVKSFGSFAELRAWLDTTLRTAFLGSLLIAPTDPENTLPS